MSRKIILKKGDYVEVISGRTNRSIKKDKKRGKIIKILRKEGKVIVSGINCFRKKAKSSNKKTVQKNEPLRMVEFPIDISNVSLIDPKSNKPTRIGIRKISASNNNNKFDKSNKYFQKTIRYAKRSGIEI